MQRYLKVAKICRKALTLSPVLYLPISQPAVDSRFLGGM